MSFVGCNRLPEVEWHGRCCCHDEFIHDWYLAKIDCQRLSGEEKVCVFLEELYKRGKVCTFSIKELN